MFKSLLRGDLINLLEDKWYKQRSYLKDTLQKEYFSCPQCGEKVQLNWAIPAKRVPHFKHKTKKNCIYGVGESDEHNKGKVMLYEHFKSIYAGKINFIDVEHYLPETKQIADIFIRFNSGKRWVIEYQRSNIPVEDIIRRKNLYRSLGINDIWIVGENLVKETGMVTKSLSNAAQALIFKGILGYDSLISFDPLENKVVFLRGLEKQNQLTYTFNNIYEHSLDELCFNIYGKPINFNDYLEIKQATHKAIGEMEMTYNAKNITHAKLSNNLYFKCTQDDNAKLIVLLQKEMWQIIPYEMKELSLDVLLKSVSSSIEDDINPIKVVGIHSNRWIKFIDKNRLLRIDNNLTSTSHLFSSLINLYNNYFRTESEFEKEVEYYHSKSKQVPHYIKNNYLKKIGVIQHDILKTSFRDLVSQEKCIELFLRIMQIQPDKKNLREQAIYHEILLTEELNMKLTNDLLFNIEDRVSNYLSLQVSNAK